MRKTDSVSLFFPVHASCTEPVNSLELDSHTSRITIRVGVDVHLYGRFIWHSSADKPFLREGPTEAPPFALSLAELCRTHIEHLYLLQLFEQSMQAAFPPQH
jgi:hypothetical protein